MPIYLPFPNFAVSAWCLSWGVLNKQRVEAGNGLLIVLRAPEKAASDVWWDMWKKSPGALAYYRDALLREWRRRGEVTSEAHLYNVLGKVDGYHWARNDLQDWDGSLPDWVGADSIHEYHRSMLYWEDPDHFGQLWDEGGKLDENSRGLWRFRSTPPWAREDVQGSGGTESSTGGDNEQQPVADKKEGEGGSPLTNEAGDDTGGVSESIPVGSDLPGRQPRLL